MSRSVWSAAYPAAFRWPARKARALQTLPQAKAAGYAALQTLRAIRVRLCRPVHYRRLLSGGGAAALIGATLCGLPSAIQPTASRRYDADADRQQPKQSRGRFGNLERAFEHKTPEHGTGV